MGSVVVIGGGVSGLLSALALSKEGFDVTVLEKNPYIGGVLRSYNVDGYRVDTGPHIITRLKQGPLRTLMDKYFNIIPDFIPHGRYFVRLNNTLRPFPWNLKDWLSLDLIPLRDRISLVKSLFTISYIFKKNKKMIEKSVADVIGDNIAPETKRFLDCMCGFMTGGTNMKDTPVERFVDAERYKSISKGNLEKLYNRVIREGATDQKYPRGGIQSLTDSILASMGGKVKIKTNESVNSIETGNNKKIVSTQEDNYTADIAIYSGLASDLPSLVKDLPTDYKKKISEMKRISSMTIWLGLNKRYFKNHGSEIWADDKPYSWVVPTSNYDPELAPKGKQLTGFAFLLQPKYNPKKEEEKALNMIEKTLPGIEKNISFKHVQYLIPEKAVFAVGNEFAEVKPPIEGLYLVGTDVIRRSMGVTRASYSVLRMIDTLKEERIL